MDEEKFPNMFIPTLPVDEGEILQVQCFGGTVQLGSETVTCKNGSEYMYDVKPNCREIGKNFAPSR